MHDKIDKALDKIIGLTIDEFEKFKPLTVAEKLAMELINAASGENSVRAIQIIAERSGGKATAKVKGEENTVGDLSKIMLDLKKANKI